jgi:hypothetical protein
MGDPKSGGRMKQTEMLKESLDGIQCVHRQLVTAIRRCGAEQPGYELESLAHEYSRAIAAYRNKLCQIVRIR